MAISMGICSHDEQGVWQEEPRVLWAWTNPESFEGVRVILAPSGAEAMVQDTLYWMRLEAGLSGEEAEALMLEDTLDRIH